MIRTINNAFAGKNDGYNCFACSPDNIIGLKMKFFANESEFWSEWIPRPEFDGWKGVTHGGIQTTLMDETAEWLIFTKYGRSAVTMELYSKYTKPLSSLNGTIKTTATEISFNRNISEIIITVYDSNGILCTEGIGKFFVFSEKDSKEKYNFPDITEF
jgi:uncharacterized protein (TIGR00369 family)